jgi:hypothetical protein
MKTIPFILSVLLLTGCSSVRLVDSWKPNKAISFKPEKVLVLGVTNNLTARINFEEKLKRELQSRGLQAVESMNVFDISFTDSKRTDDEIEAMISGLSEAGFDAVIITMVKGVDRKINYSPGHTTVGYHWERFGRYYYRFQSIYYNPGYYNEYKIYIVETGIFNISEEDEKSLVWIGAFEIVNPEDIRHTVNDYVKAIIKQLEKEGLLSKPKI